MNSNNCSSTDWYTFHVLSTDHVVISLPCRTGINNISSSIQAWIKYEVTPVTLLAHMREHKFWCVTLESLLLKTQLCSAIKSTCWTLANTTFHCDQKAQKSRLLTSSKTKYASTSPRQRSHSRLFYQLLLWFTWTAICCRYGFNFWV